MPGLVRKRLPSADQIDSDSEGSSTQPNKRARLTNGASNDETSYHDRQDNGRPKFQPGSIRRVTLKNFVTYTNAEFLPGPSLNMVIGPNGTGKSTLVCAICLGLGWKTEHLGRAKNPAEFVKHGHREATIEIELERDPHRHDENPVVKHVIRREGGKSAYFLNGKASTNKAVIELCRSLSIQVDNLCQFLPQDRVVEFAALSPVDLLTQTQRAAAPDHLVQWHDQLKDLYYRQKILQQEKVAMTEALKTLDNRQNNQRADVDRIRERSELKERLEALEMYRPVVQYRQAKREYEAQKLEKQKAQQDLTRLRSDAEPARDAVAAKQKYRQAIATVLTQKGRVIERSEQNVKNAYDQQDRIKEEIKACEASLEAEQKTVKDDKLARTRLEGQIAELERQSNQPPPQFDAADFNEKIRELTRQSREATDQADEIRRQMQSSVQQHNEKNRQREQINQDLAALRSQAGQQETKLKQVSRDTNDAWQWLQNNSAKLPGPVFGPPMVTCSVPEAKNAQLVENVLSNSDLVSFTVTTKETYEALQRILYKEMGWSDINIKVVPNTDFPQPPLPEDQLKAVGLDCYLLSLIKGPPEVLSMLCQFRNIHQTGVTFRSLSAANAETISKTPISSYVTPTETLVITRRREYGDQGVSTKQQKLRPARFFGAQAVDSQAEQDMKRKLAELTGEMTELKAAHPQQKKAAEELESTRADLEGKKKSLTEEKSRIQQVLSKHRSLGTRLKEVQTKLEHIATREQTQQERVQGINDQQSKLVFDRGQAALSFVNAVRTLTRMHTEVYEAELLLIEAQSACTRVEAQNTDVMAQLEVAERTVAELSESVRVKATEARALLADATSMAERRSQHHQDVHDAQPSDQTVDDLENEITSTAARLDMFHEGDPNLMREFEERAAKIEKSRHKLGKVEQDLGRFNAEIEVIQSRWEPELDELIEKISEAFSDNFSRIGCAGEVRVHKEEDYANWAIQVLVKFRENEELSVLDAHRQSGGERAVSTIFYLMALQSLARAPFRVVDEINQGMDPRNERLVHSRIVNIACAEHTSQYFLITPKLLPNLTYHPNMKVHCIASGEYMPADYKKLDFEAIARKALSTRRELMNGSAIAV